MRKSTNGFTIVELLVVVVIIGILSTIGVFSYFRIQANTRDSQRSAKITIIAEALEKYYDKNGEYPSCYAMAQTANTVSTTTLSGLDPEVLKTPSAANGTNSILPLCADLPVGTDAIAYVGDGSIACTSVSSPKDCLEWTLKYREEATGNIISITSRRNISASNAGNISDLTISSTSFVQAGLTWAVIGSATSYNIQKATNSSFTVNMTESTSATNTSTVAGLSMNTKYYFRVRANFTSGSGNWSNIANTTTLNLTVPVASLTANSTSQITLSWSAITNATSYNVDMSTSPSFTSPTSDVGLTGTSRVYTGLVANTTYYFRLQSAAAGVTTSWSSTTNTATLHLATPVITVTVNSSTQMTVSWASIPMTTNYGYHGSKASSFSPLIYANTTTNTSQVFTGLSQGTTYYFRVYAANSNDNSGWSTTVSATTGVDAPAAPSISAYLSGGWAYGSAGAVSCPAGTTAYYQIPYQVNADPYVWPGWTGSLVATGTTQGFQYSYGAYAYCQGPNAASGASGGNGASVIIPIDTPAAPCSSAWMSGANAIGASCAISCNGGTPTYQVAWNENDGGINWVGWAGSSTTVYNATQGYKYGFVTYAFCDGAYADSATVGGNWSSVIRPFDTPAAPTYLSPGSFTNSVYAIVNYASYCPGGSSVVPGSNTYRTHAIWNNSYWGPHPFGYNDWWGVAGRGSNVEYWGKYQCYTGYATSPYSPESYNVIHVY